MNYPQQILNFFLDTVFPIKCISCGSFSSANHKDYLCKTCLSLIPVKKQLTCINCNRTSTLGRTCSECRSTSAIDQLMVVSDYKNPLVEKAIKTLKYRLIPEIAGSLRPVIRKYLNWLTKDKGIDILADNPLLVPVPLHHRRLNSRGFNQAELIANIIADTFLYKTTPSLLVRVLGTKPQAEIENREERLKNSTGIFEINNGIDIKNKTIILIDDVCTTGSTLNEAAKILKNGGAKKVIGFVIAQG